MGTLGWFIVKEVRRQMHVTVASDRVTLGIWSVNRTWPFLLIREVAIPWSSVQQIRRAGLTLILDTHLGEKSINLLLFEDAGQVEQFAFEQWKASHQRAQTAV